MKLTVNGNIDTTTVVYDPEDPVYVGLYATDGSVNCVEVDGTTYTGLFHVNGALNVYVDGDDDTLLGSTHPCGALRVVSQTGFGYYSASGAVNV